MRKKCLALAAVLLSLQISGCGAIKLTTQEKNVIAEYIASILLKHDKTYEPTLQYDFGIEDEAEEEITKEDLVTDDTEIGEETTKEETSEQESTEKPLVEQQEEEAYLDVSSIYEKGLKVSYKGCAFYQEYPKKTDAILPVEASAGNTICVVELKVKNVGNSDKKVDFLTKNYVYQLSVNSNKTYKAVQSFLVEDIQYLDVTLKPGKSKEAVVVFEIPKKAKNKDFSLLITKGSKTAELALK